jgi:hypothetical protein
MCRHRFLWFAVVGVLFLPLSLQAQTTTGSIRGFVKDQNGVPIDAAEIQASNPVTGVQRSATSRDDGSYVLPGLAPATYELAVRKIGFSPQRRQVTVQVGATMSVDFTLQAGALELQAVAVETTPAVEMRTSEIATNVTQQQIQQLPSNSRNFLDLAQLAPGVTVTEDRINSGAGFRTFSAGAQGANQVNLFVDGASLKNDLTGGGVAGQDASRGNPFPRNAIQEYRVVTQNFKAEYQKASSAIITATTRSGGNQWSGNAFLGYQNKGLLALDTFQIKDKNANPTGFKKPDYSRVLSGIAVGGPLIRNRLFFFGSYEGNYQNRANTVAITAPTGFADLDTVNLAQFNGHITSPFRETLLFGKLNYTLGNRSSLELSYSNRHETDVRDFGGQVAAQSAVNYRQDIGIGILKHSYFSGEWLNEASVTFQNFTRNPSPDISDLPSREFQNGSASSCCTSFGRIGSFLSIQDFTQKRLGFRDDITYTGFGGGEHVLKAGVTVDMLNYDIIKRNDETPHFFYTDTIFRNGDTLAYNYQSPYQMTWQYGNPGLKADNTQVGLYLQDDWTPVRRLTLNLGVRWDYETHMMNYDYVTPQAVRDTIRLYNSQLFFPIDTLEYFTDGTRRERFKGAIQPRLGFSYSLDAEDRTAVFGGWGLFYDRSLFDMSVDETLKLQRPSYTVFFAHPDSTPAANEVAWSNNYLTTDTSVLAPLVTGAPGSLGEVWLIPNHAKAPKSNQWNVGIRHAFGTVVASVAYTNVRGYDQLVFNWANIKWNNFGTDSSACCDFSRTPFHGFSNILYATHSGNTWYEALQVQLTRPYRNTGNWGWGGGLTYTNGKRSLEGIDFPNDQFAFPGTNVIPKHPVNDEQSRMVANWVMDVPVVDMMFSGLLTLGSGVRQDLSGRFDPRNWKPGAVSVPTGTFPLVPGSWGYRNLDLRLRKDFAISNGNVGVTADLFNTFNHQNYGCTNGGVSPNCVISDPRRLQVGAEYSF